MKIQNETDPPIGRERRHTQNEPSHWSREKTWTEQVLYASAHATAVFNTNGDDRCHSSNNSVMFTICDISCYRL